MTQQDAPNFRQKIYILKTFLRFIFSATSENAGCLAIVVAHSMNKNDLKQIADYYEAVWSVKK